ncbi:hypothetical protein [uncultured Phascolarctobacterium sp.]|uniref:hypothetical protein n=1 Tax=uncultured Phascolarctobacterium sp. TaxID=512296 RepID=UPI0025D0234F|nr:hypothetical protein [uncultured Phascolarctobacterium sp.]
MKRLVVKLLYHISLKNAKRGRTAVAPKISPYLLYSLQDESFFTYNNHALGSCSLQKFTKRNLHKAWLYIISDKTTAQPGGLPIKVAEKPPRPRQSLGAVFLCPYAFTFGS